MSTDKDGTQVEEWQDWNGRIVRRDSDGWQHTAYAADVNALTRKAAQAEALAAAGQELLIALANEQSIDEPRLRLSHALASYASNPAEAGA